MEDTSGPKPAPDHKSLEDVRVTVNDRRAAGQQFNNNAHIPLERQRAERQASADREAMKDELEAEEQIAARRTEELAMSRRLIQAGTAAAAVLGADTAFTKIAHGRVQAWDLQFFKEEDRIERERYLDRLVVFAGRGLLDAFTELFQADKLWERLAHSESELRRKCGTGPDGVRNRMELAELLTHHIPEILLDLGYVPPPPAEDWTDIIQSSVEVLAADSDDSAAASNAEKARHELAFFNQRLRRVVEDAERTLAATDSSPAEQRAVIGRRLRAAVSIARNKTVPAAVAAGTEAVVAAAIAAAGPVGIGIALLSGTLASLLGSASEAAATAIIAEHGSQAAGLSPVQLVRTGLDALDDCIDLMRPENDAASQKIAFIIRRGVFQILQDAAPCEFPVRNFLWRWSEALLRRLEAGNLSVADAHERVDSARQFFSGRSDTGSER